MLLRFLQDPADYGELLGALREGGDAGPPAELRRRLAWKAFQHCATYDSTVAEWLWGQIGALPCLESLIGSAGCGMLCTCLMASISSQQVLTTLPSCAHPVHSAHPQGALHHGHIAGPTY